MTDLKAVLKQFQESDRALNKAIRENGDAFINSLFETIFDTYPTVTKLATLGSTPYFNDGDLCTHSAGYCSGEFSYYSWRSDPTKKNYDYEDYSVLEEFFTGESSDDDEEEESLDIQEATNAVNVEVDEDLVNAEAKAAKEMMEEFDTIFERIYATNYIVTAERLADGTIEVKHEDYEPDY